MPQFLFDTDHLTLFHYNYAPLMQCIGVHPPGAVAKVENGRLADVAPTLLDLLGLPKPAAMTGHSLIVSDRKRRAAE